MQNPEFEFSEQYQLLLAMAFHAEKVAGRRLALQRGCSQELALLEILEEIAALAGLAGWSQLLAQRAAQRSMLANKLSAVRQRKEEARRARQLQQQAPAHAWQAWFDGSAHPNPGRCGIGALLIAPDGRQFEISQDAAYGDSSDAEYRALIALLQRALPLQPEFLMVYGDSQVVINDVQQEVDDGLAMHGVQLLPGRLQLYRREARALMRQLSEVCFCWVPRHKNAAADALSQAASRSITAGFIPATH
ncbi:ribonuclease HI family protein [Undibacterium sp.]|uniref:ribonuclease HI family protein n=1 Tax=Undibacterium sp. TaxID=1914977 RepID=UPI0025F209F4|nr:ribonuclease HI family protein [Undibacterium sp.]